MYWTRYTATREQSNTVSIGQFDDEQGALNIVCNIVASTVIVVPTSENTMALSYRQEPMDLVSKSTRLIICFS